MPARIQMDSGARFKKFWTWCKKKIVRVFPLIWNGVESRYYIQVIFIHILIWQNSDFFWKDFEILFSDAIFLLLQVQFERNGYYSVKIPKKTIGKIIIRNIFRKILNFAILGCVWTLLLCNTDSQLRFILAGKLAQFFFYITPILANVWIRTCISSDFHLNPAKFP